MSDRSHSPRRDREIPRYNGAVPEARPQQKLPIYDPGQRPRWGIVLGVRGSWWVWLSIGIGLTVVAGSLFEGGVAMAGKLKQQPKRTVAMLYRKLPWYGKIILSLMMLAGVFHLIDFIAGFFV